MQRSYAELKSECDMLNLEYEEPARKAKKPFIDALQKHFLQNVEMTFGLKYRLSMESPQLARLCKNLKPNEIVDIYESEDWVFEEKHNGLRMIVTYDSSDGLEIFGRNLSVKNYLPVNYRNSVYFENDQNNLDMPNFVLDSEVISVNPTISTVMGKTGVVTETELQAIAALFALNDDESQAIQREMGQPIRFMVFDCLRYGNKDLRNEPYYVRRRYMKKVVEALKSKLGMFRITKVILKRKEEFLEHLWSQGKEGCIAKNIHVEYLDRSTRPRNGWIKFKRTTTGTLGDTIDGFVIGFEPGTPGKGFENLVGALHIGINLQLIGGLTIVHEIARVVNLKLATREKITVYDENGKPQLIESMYNKVVEIEGQAVSARARRLTHPRLLRLRSDKSAHDCEITEEALDGMIV